MSELTADIKDFLDLNNEAVLIRVTKKEGSAPRDYGTVMLVDSSSSVGTIGGGSLEYTAVESARNFINDPEFSASSCHYTLGPVLGQCCGGKVELSFKKVTPKLKRKLLREEILKNASLDQVLIFGAGHVGQSLFQQLKPIPLNVSIIDSRPPETLDFDLPQSCKTTAFPEAEVRNARPNTAFVILTHDHGLDFILVKEALVRKDAAYVGMIGSQTKKKVLKNWLEREDVAGYEQLYTPLGASLANVKDLNNEPSVIASLIIVEILVAFQINKTRLLAKKETIELKA